jgi:hypothetical protein
MSLYDIEEICTGCKHAELCECCGLLRGCKKDAQNEVNNYSGECKQKEQELPE